MQHDSVLYHCVTDNVKCPICGIKPADSLADEDFAPVGGVRSKVLVNGPLPPTRLLPRNLYVPRPATTLEIIGPGEVEVVRVAEVVRSKETDAHTR